MNPNQIPTNFSAPNYPQKNNQYPQQPRNNSMSMGYPQQPNYNQQPRHQSMNYNQPPGFSQQNYNNPYPQQGFQNPPNPNFSQNGFNNNNQPYPPQNQGYPQQNQGYPQQSQQYPQQNQGYPMQNQGYPQQNQGYQQQPYMNQNSFMKQIIMAHADNLFMKYDTNRSGYLDVKEMYGCISELYVTQGFQQPTYQQVINVMKDFDDDRNGLIDMSEFRSILLKLTGN